MFTNCSWTFARSKQSKQLVSQQLDDVFYLASASIATGKIPTSYKLDVLEMWLLNLSHVEGLSIPDIFWECVLLADKGSSLDTAETSLANKLRTITLMATYRAHPFDVSEGLSELLETVEKYQDQISAQNAAAILTRIQGILELCNVPTSELPDPFRNLEAFKVLDETGRYVEVTNLVHRLMLFIDQVRQRVAQQGFNKQN